MASHAHLEKGKSENPIGANPACLKTAAYRKGWERNTTSPTGAAHEGMETVKEAEYSLMDVGKENNINKLPEEGGGGDPGAGT